MSEMVAQFTVHDIPVTLLPIKLIFKRSSENHFELEKYEILQEYMTHVLSLDKFI